MDLSRSGQPVQPSTTDSTSDSSRRPAGQPGAETTTSTGYATTGPIGANPDAAATTRAKRPAAKPTTGGGASTFGATAPMAMSCEQLVPAAVRDRIRPGLTVTTMSANSGAAAITTATTTEVHAQAATTCQLLGPGLTQPVAIKADCEQPQGKVAAASKKQPGAHPVQIGKGGTLEQQGDVSHLTAVDANSNCRIDLTVPKDVDAVAIGQAVLDQLPPPG